jgi:Protein of unknown function (DUF3025)
LSSLEQSLLIDWSAPWFNPYAALGQSVLDGCKRMDLVQSLNLHKGALELLFISQEQARQACAESYIYESFIQTTRCIPTRVNAHDFFNGISWIQFPRTKSSVLQIQAREICAVSKVDGLHNTSEALTLKTLGPSPKEHIDAIDALDAIDDIDDIDKIKLSHSCPSKGSFRGEVRDALTVFDENGILLQADPRLWEMLERSDWDGLFIHRRDLWASAKVWLFGHALLEKLLTPRFPITGHVLCLKIPMDLCENKVDDWVGGQVLDITWAEKPFVPLPVLGIPGWFAANAAPDFYKNREVFRVKKSNQNRSEVQKSNLASR